MGTFGQVAKIGFARISLVLGAGILLVFSVGFSQPLTAEDKIMSAFGLKSGEIITIKPERMGKSELAIKVNREDYVIDYAFHSIRSKDFRLLVQNEHGELVEQTAPPVSTIRGSLRGIDGSSVTVSYTHLTLPTILLV